MKVTIGQLKLSEPSLIKLSQQDLPVAMAFQLSRLIRQIAPELNSLEETRQKLVSKYGVPDLSTGQTVVQEEQVQKFTDEIKPILDTEIQIDFEKIPLSKIPEKIQLSCTDIMALDPFIDTSV